MESEVLNCGDVETRSYYKNLFYQCNNFEDFLDLWGQFYENKVCIPSYYGSFVGGSDNKQATFELGKKI